jgi:hypothetical protein
VDIRLLEFFESFGIFETKEHSLQRDKSGDLDRINRVQKHVEPEIGLEVKRERDGRQHRRSVQEPHH